MSPQDAQKTLDKIMGQICGYQNPYNIEQFMQKYAFDVRLPFQVNDSTTGEETWAQSMNPTKFITMDNARKRVEIDDFMLPKQPINSLEDVLAAWNEVNYVSTERQLESDHMGQSDNIYNSEYVFRSQDVHRSKNILFSDGCLDSEYAACIQRSNHLTYCVRVEDSKECSGSFEISWSSKVTNSFFIHDSYDMYECLFCSHLSGKKFCIANMQFEEEEYYRIKDMVIRWILTP